MEPVDNFVRGVSLLGREFMFWYGLICVQTSIHFDSRAFALSRYFDPATFPSFQGTGMTVSFW
jgi:hypothetical protein